MSAPIDLASYAFGWLWVLVPLAMLGDARPDYLALYIVVLIVTDMHRHWGLPYVYLDGQVRSRFKLRFFVFPAVMLLLWAASPDFKRSGWMLAPVDVAALAGWIVVLVQLLGRDRDGEPVALGPIVGAALPAAFVGLVAAMFAPAPGWAVLAAAIAGSVALARSGAGTVRRWIAPALVLGAAGAAAVVPGEPTVAPVALLNFAAVVSAAWNVWHVYMQKYGILRLYNAKSGVAAKVPGWIDRLLVLAWLPFYFLWLGPEYRDVITSAFKRGNAFIVPVIDVMAALQPYLLVPAIGLIVAACGLFVTAEWRVNRLRNAPRLWMALGTTALSSMFLLVHPIKAYLAYGFSHAIEYMVFVWAFQRRRYAAPLAHDPLLGRLLRRPVLAYGAFAIGLAAIFFVLKFWGRSVFVGAPRPRLFDIDAVEWVSYWTVYQSLVHFYFDGFLWKMRMSTTRAHI